MRVEEELYEGAPGAYKAIRGPIRRREKGPAAIVSILGGSCQIVEVVGLAISGQVGMSLSTVAA